MAGGLIVLLPLIAVAATLVVVLLVVPRRRALVAVDESEFPALAHLRRSTLLSRPVAVVLGLAVAVVVAMAGQLGRGMALVPAAFAAIQILGVLAADLVARHDARTPGSAGLETRRVRDILPVRLARWTVLTAAALAVLLTWTTVVGSPDDAGRAGRSLSYTCSEDCTSAALGPWPGSYYSVPMATALVVVAALASLALVVTVRRPRNGSDGEIRRVDDAVRRRSVESVVASVGLAVSGSLVGTGLLTGLGLAGASRAPVGLQIGGWMALAAGLAALILLGWSIVLLAVPGGPIGVEGRRMPVGSLHGGAGSTDGAIGTRRRGPHR